MLTVGYNSRDLVYILNNTSHIETFTVRCNVKLQPRCMQPVFCQAAAAAAICFVTNVHLFQLQFEINSVIVMCKLSNKFGMAAAPAALSRQLKPEV